MSNVVIAGKHLHLSMHSLYKFDIRVGYHKGPTCCLLVAMMCTVVMASWPVSKLTCEWVDVSVSELTIHRVDVTESWLHCRQDDLSLRWPQWRRGASHWVDLSASWLHRGKVDLSSTWLLPSASWHVSKLTHRQAVYEASRLYIWQPSIICLWAQHICDAQCPRMKDFAWL